MRPTLINYITAFISVLLAIYFFVWAGLRGTFRIAPEISLLIVLLSIFAYNFKIILNKDL